MVDVGVADEEIESYSRTARGEDVVDGRDHLDTVDEPLEHVALNSRLHHVPVLNTVLRADELLQRGEVPYLPVPTHDFRVSLVRLETPEEHLVPGAEMWRDRAAQPYLDLLEVLGRRILAENGAPSRAGSSPRRPSALRSDRRSPLRGWSPHRSMDRGCPARRAAPRQPYASPIRRRDRSS